MFHNANPSCQCNSSVQVTVVVSLKLHVEKTDGEQTTAHKHRVNTALETGAPITALLAIISQKDSYTPDCKISHKCRCNCQQSESASDQPYVCEDAVCH